MTSPGRWAWPLGMFSAIARYAVTLSDTPSRAIATTDASTEAAPAMSHFMVIIEAGGFSDRPPESKVIPLPTSARCPLAPAGA